MPIPSVSGRADRHVVARGIRRVLTQSPRDSLTTLRVLLTIAFVEVLIRTVKLQRLSQLLGCPLDVTPRAGNSSRLTLRELPPTPRRQVLCTRRVAAVWPFSKGPCLRESLVAGHLLRRMRPTLRIGLVGGQGEFYTHAWLELGGRPLEDLANYAAFDVTPSGAPM